MEPARPIFWNVHEHYRWAEYAQYVLGGLVFLAFLWGLWQHVRKWRLGRPESAPSAIVERLKACMRFALLQGRLASDRYAWAMHLAIFFGMAVLFLGTALATVDLDVTHLLFGFQFLRGHFYLGYKLVLDVFAVALVAGLLLAFYRRYVLQPERLKSLVYPTFPLDSCYLLAILFLIAVTGLIVEGLRLAAALQMGKLLPEWAAWSIVGNALARLFRPLSVDTLNRVHFAFWCVHGLAAFTFIALIPHSKAFHLVSSAISIYLRNLAPPGALLVGEPAGVARISDFTRRQLLQFDACTWCGRCQEQCPAHVGGYSLSPKNLVLKLDEHLLKVAGRNGQSQGNAAGQTVGAGELHGKVVAAAELWACTTCRACEEVCPVFIEQPRAIVDLRRHLVSQGQIDKTLQDALGSLNRYGNSFAKSDRMRARWTQGLEPKIKDARKEEVDYLWFVGDYASYDPRVVELTKAAARLFQRAGLSFGILYEAERNAGNDVRRVGEEGLYELLKEKNQQALGAAKFKAILTTDPHTLNALKNEYALANGVEVKHYTEVLDELIQQGRLVVRPKLAGRVTYHDPCYLGRYNGVYDPPRRILGALGVELVEMPRHRERSFCCGAGGGRVWMEDAPGVRERPAESRVREAAALPGVTTMVVACPKEIGMFGDAVKTTGNEGKLAIKDIAELIAEALE